MRSAFGEMRAKTALLRPGQSPKRGKPLSQTAHLIMPKRRHHFTVTNQFEFGNSTPKWTIGASRHDKRDKDDIPGPGYYRTTEKVTKFSHIIENRPVTSDRTLTSDLDFRVEREFPKIRPVTIGTRGELVYGEKYESHEPVFFVTDTFKKLRWNLCKIGERRPDREPDPVPPPGSYNPVNTWIQNGPMFTIPKAQTRAIEADKADLPGPGAYELTTPVKSYTRWAERLMVKSKRWHPPDDPRSRPWRTSK